MLVPQDDDGALPGGSEIGQPDRLVGGFDPDNPGTLLSLPTEPGDGIRGGAVHARWTPNFGTAMHAPTASHVQSSVGRFGPYLRHSGAITR